MTLINYLPTAFWWCVGGRRHSIGIPLSHLSCSKECLTEINATAGLEGHLKGKFIELQCNLMVFKPYLKLNLANEATILLSSDFSLYVVRTEHWLLELHVLHYLMRNWS